MKKVTIKQLAREVNGPTNTKFSLPVLQGPLIKYITENNEKEHARTPRYSNLIKKWCTGMLLANTKLTVKADDGCQDSIN